MLNFQHLWATSCWIPNTGAVIGSLNADTGIFWWADGEKEFSLEGCAINQYCQLVLTNN